MYRQFLTMMRGAAHTANEEFADRHALSTLRQQLRDSARAVAAARRAVAIAMAQTAQENVHNDALNARIEDLETRAMAALEQGKTELAHEAAVAITTLDIDAKVSRETQQRIENEISRLKQNVRNAESRLRKLQRGQRLASATHAAQQLHGQVTDDHFSSLAEAEATLLRLQRRQREVDLTAKSHAEMGADDCSTRLTEKLAEAGCGEPLHVSADDVIARLNKRLFQKSTPAPPQS